MKHNILVSTISFVNDKKEGSDIYTTFAKRLINDVITKTPYDILVTTNKIDFFTEIDQSNRITIREDNLENHKTHVGAFNQLLKFCAIKDIPKKYDWVLYLDCDAGFTEQVNINEIDSKIDTWIGQGFDMLGLLYGRSYHWAENEFLETQKNQTHKKLFDDKFKFYGIDTSLRNAYLPSEHILLIKNDEKLKKMCEEFENFCTKFETQDETWPITFDMEAFEIGVSAFLAGYNMGEMDWGNQCNILKVGFNHNNWEKIKR